MCSPRSDTIPARPYILVAFMFAAGLGMGAASLRPSALPSIFEAWGSRGVALDFVTRNMLRHASLIGAVGVVSSACAVLLLTLPMPWWAFLKTARDTAGRLGFRDANSGGYIRHLIVWLVIIL